MTRTHFGRLPAIPLICCLPLLCWTATSAAAQGYQQTNLVTDDPSVTPAAITDPNLVNPWGIALSPRS